MAETLLGGGPDPERATRRRERDDALGSALAKLEPRDRLMLALRVQDGLPASRVARILGLPSPFHVYRQVDRLLQRLRADLDQAGITETSA